ncbi:MAG TPA: tripartite tricarboxylate transporter permease, partial [Myxococcaceae bacterium]|nr:tripartite tricarboxylate transporter permease [Myxococcaceae bacterium]
QVMQKQPELVWGMIASMWVGNLMLLVINLPLIGVWVRLLKVPYRLLFPAIVIVCCVGIYSVNNSPQDVLLTAFVALFGYAASRLGFESAPLLLGFVLGRLLEENLRRALAISRGDLAIFVTRPVSAWLLLTGLIVLVVAVLPNIRSRREEVFVE